MSSVSQSAQVLRVLDTLPIHLVDPREVIAWATEAFGDGLTLVTSLGPQTLAVIDMLDQMEASVEIVSIDTGLLFAETHLLRRQVQDRYGVSVKLLRPNLTLAEQARTHGSKLWKEAPDTCCRLRKVEPLDRALSGRAAWITGLRRDQSPSRARVETFEFDEERHLVKVSPFAHWSRAEVFQYLLDNDVPFNPLLLDGYSSVGCWPCTRPCQQSEHEREGRWDGHTKTECGIHSPLTRLREKP